MSKADHYHAKALAAFHERRDLAAALRHAEKAARRGGRLVVHWCVLAFLQEEAGAIRDAIASLGRAIACLDEPGAYRSAACGCRAPEPAFVHAHRASLLRQGGQLEAALEDLEAALALDPTPDLHCRVATIEADLGRPRAARAAFLRALRIDRRDAGALHGLASLHMEDDPARARRYLSRLLRAHPDDPLALGAWGLLHWREGRDAEAEEILRRAIRADGAIELPKLVLARLLMDRGALEEAEHWLDAARRIDPLSVGVGIHQGDLAQLRGQVAAAEEAWRSVLRMEPGDPGTVLRLAGLLLDDGRAREALTLLRDELVRAPSGRSTGAMRSLLAAAEVEAAEQAAHGVRYRGAS